MSREFLLFSLDGSHVSTSKNGNRGDALSVVTILTMSCVSRDFIAAGVVRVPVTKLQSVIFVFEKLNETFQLTTMV